MIPPDGERGDGRDHSPTATVERVADQRPERQVRPAWCVLPACALPGECGSCLLVAESLGHVKLVEVRCQAEAHRADVVTPRGVQQSIAGPVLEKRWRIGRASCRERVYI